MPRIILYLSLILLGISFGPAACQQAPSSAEANVGTGLTGLQLYERLACHGCHSRRGTGGTIGPALDRLDERLSPNEVLTQLLTPRRRQSASRMPSFAFLKIHEQKALATFVHSGKE